MKKNILIINCGSSSVKFALINPLNGEVALLGLAERLGHKEALFTWTVDKHKISNPLAVGDHAHAMKKLIEILEYYDLRKSIVAIGHRVVHGGEHFTDAVLIDKKVLATLTACTPLAPLHNPANLLGINIAQAHFNVPHCAVFDTSFHQTMPQRAFLYAIPLKFYQQEAIRRYGFHGTSFRYVSQQAAILLKRPLNECAFICAHLGNGASACAILNGKSIDTTMGLTPLEGLVMGTRSGDIDPGLFAFLAMRRQIDVHTLDDILNKESGLLGLSGLSNDCRTLEEAAAQNHERAQLALDIFCYRLAKSIAALRVSLPRLDALLFTGGIGENSVWVRQRVVAQLSFLNLSLDPNKNALMIRGQTGPIEQNGSIPIWVIHTNEEWMIAQDTATLIGLRG